MKFARSAVIALLATLSIYAQDLEGDGWRLDLGLSYLSTSGNSETSSLGFTPNLEDTDDLRIAALVGLTASITDIIGVKLAYEARYDAEPVPGFKDIDTQATVSLVMKMRREAGE